MRSLGILKEVPLDHAGAINLPFNEGKQDAFVQHVGQIEQQLNENKIRSSDGISPDSAPDQQPPRQRFCVVCRRGNDSQRVVHLLRQNGINDAVDLVGGLEAWAGEPGVEFPGY